MREFLILIGVSFILQGCLEAYEEGAPIADRIAKTKQDAIRKAHNQTIEKLEDKFNPTDVSLFYMQKGRDPFTASGELADMLGPKDYGPKDVGVLKRLVIDPLRPIGYKKDVLEEYEIKSLNFIGVIIKKTGDKIALIDVGNNKILDIKEGDYIGRDHGKVVKIDTSGAPGEEKILIEEKFASTSVEDSNAWVLRSNELRLKIK